MTPITNDMYHTREGRLFYEKLNVTVWLFIIGYALFFSFKEAYALVACLSLGIFILNPLCYFLEKRGFHTQSRFLFIISSLFYIWASPATLLIHVDVEYYFIPSMLFAILIFDSKQNLERNIGMILPLLTWMMVKWGPMPDFPSSWMAHTVDGQMMSIINFIGAFVITFIFLFNHVQAISSIKQKAIEHEKQLGDRLNNILESMLEGLTVHDHNGAIIKHNRAAEEILGLSYNKHTGRVSTDPNLKAIKPDGSDFPDQDHPAMVALKTDQPILGVIMGICLPNGQCRWLKINATPSQNVELKNKQVTVTFNDITEQKQTLDQLQSSKSETENFFSVSNDLMGVAGVDGFWKKTNPAFTMTLGFSSTEMTQQPFLELIHPDDVLATQNEVQKLSMGAITINFENRYRCKNGEFRLINWNATPDVKHGLIYAAGRDVTEFRIKEMELKQILNSVDQSSIVAITDKKGFIIEANDNFCKISGFERHELIGKNHRILNSGVHSKEFFKDMWQTISKGDIWSGTIQNKTKHGAFYWVQTVITPLRDHHGQVNRYLSIRFDITDLKNAEKKLVQSSKMASLGEMAGGIAHEINNPLAIIMAKASLIKRDIDKPELNLTKIKADLERIEFTTERIAKIIRGLKTFSRDADKDPTELVSVSRIVQETFEICQEKFRIKSIPLNLFISNDVMFECRPSQLSQVLLNLLNNAFDVIENLSEKWVNISITHQDESLKFQIIDSGTGISPENLEKIMQPFFTTKEVGKGTGLGLSISKGIIEDHHGKLYYELNQGHTSFVIEMPLKQTNQLNSKVA